MIHVVVGHICSGKSTYVRQHAEHGDIVIDLDRLALALSIEGTPHHDYPDNVRDVARAARWSAIDFAARAHAAGGFDVWIIHAYPEPRDVVTYRRLGAVWHEVEAEPDVLVDRAARERPVRCQRVLERELSKGVGSPPKLKTDGRPHDPSTRISAGFSITGGLHGKPRPDS